MKLPLFGISGLRGVVGHDLFPETVARMAAAFGAMTGAGRVALGRDSRVSGEMYTAAAAAGLASAGCTVVDLGIGPTPTVLHHVRTSGLDAGIVITASHNPDRWNGMKFCRADGRFLSAHEVAQLRERFEQGGERAEWLALRPARRDDSAVAKHVAAVAASPLFAFKHRKLRIGIDAVNGAASVAAPALVRALGAEPVPLYCDPSPESMASGFPRRPEPMPEHLGALAALVRDSGLDAGFAFDPDGDRFSCVDETGCALGEEATICLACRYVLARKPGPVVVNLSTTRAVEDVCGEFGVPVLRTPVGEIQVVAKVDEVGAALGGEGNGGVILPEVNPTRDGLVAAAAVLGLMAAGSKLSALRAALPHYEMVKATAAATGDVFARCVPRLEAELAPVEPDRQDGLWFGGPDWWLHCRPSNTEPLVRLIAEARTRAAAEELVKRARAAIGPECEPA